MEIRDLLQQALQTASNERIAASSVVQTHEIHLAQFKSSVQSAQTERASMAMIHDAADKNYRKLLDYCNSRTDQSDRNSLSAEIERLAQEVSKTAVNLRMADDAVRRAQSRMSDMERDRSVAQANLSLATERWEQIRKQLNEAGPQL